MVVKIDVFTSVFCPHSPAAVNIMKRLAPDFKGRIEWNIISVETSEGKEKAKIIGIRDVPTIVMDGKIVFIGAPRKEELAAEITKRL
jgi:small redox-active disulfide protein 1